MTGKLSNCWHAWRNPTKVSSPWIFRRSEDKEALNKSIMDFSEHEK